MGFLTRFFTNPAFSMSLDTESKVSPLLLFLLSVFLSDYPSKSEPKENHEVLLFSPLDIVRFFECKREEGFKIKVRNFSKSMIVSSR
ncbi:hypothetical protein DLM75_00130 [Leptospira stimsonii]|uniref:Uncharacterized protein n=1 Tax=Leptospira stimsonii TaxID=2202203 RepID=A0A396ZAY6_9LEPT|nr:hypothetical protein DLM75_00130 [Leptospira stimsonii]